MALSGKLEFQEEIKSSPDEFFNIFCSKKSEVMKICPDLVPYIEVREGSWDEVGSILLVNYILDGGQFMIGEEIIDAVDLKNKSITYKHVGGDLMKLYTTFKITIQAIKNGDTNFLKWTMEYEKINENVQVLDDKQKKYGIQITKAIDAHCLQTA